MSSINIAQWIVMIPVLLFAITIHEYSHGMVAYSLGDPTAKNAGRLTLNPISHLDPLGAICLFFFHFGWAKPVPVNVMNFRNMRRDIILMSLSGPLANLSAAFVAGLFLRVFPLDIDLYKLVLLYMIIFNVGLGIFNLLPIPPLDGSHVMENLLPYRAAERYRQIGRYAPIVLIGIFIMDRFLYTNIIGRVLNYPIALLVNLFSGIKLF